MGRAKHAIPEEVKKLRGRPPKRIKYVYYNRNMDFVKKVDELNLTTGNLAENWKIFWRNFEIFATAIELAKKDEKVQVAIFLNAAGKEAADTFENVIQLTEAERMKYKSVVKSFEEFCTGKTNEVYESFLFHKRDQKENEPFDNFLMEVTKLVKRCGFTDENRMVRDRIVLGTNDKHLQKKLLEIEGLTLQKAINTARAAEATNIHMSAMKPSESSMDHIKQQRDRNYSNSNNDKFINKNHRKSNTNNFSNNSKYNNVNNSFRKDENVKVDFECKFCGKIHVRGKCPAYGKNCSKCNGKNHFAIVCKKKSVSKLTTENYNSDESDEQFAVDLINQTIEQNNSWFEVLKIQSKLIKFKLDTGADANVLPFKYLSDFNNINLIEPTNKLIAYNGSEIKTMGMVNLECIAKNTIAVQQFFVINSESVPILGLQSCTDLKLIKRINELNINQKAEFIEKNNKAFTGLGCFYKNFNIQLKENAISVAKPSRRIPISLRKPLEEELKRLCNNDIIEPVHEPCEWVSNIVIVEKPNKKIRICLDPKYLNASIKEHYYEIPSIEQIISNFSNKNFFSVFDIREGFF